MDDGSREFSRVFFPVEVHFALADGRTINGQAENVSLNGVLVWTDVEPPLGSEGDLTLAFTHEGRRQEARGHGRIARVTSTSVAIQIVEIELEGYERLREMILFHADEPEQFVAELDRHIGLRQIDDE